MDHINRIVVTGDTLRQRAEGGSSQNENILWLFHQVKPALELLTRFPVSSLLFSGRSDCLGTRLFAANRLPVSFDSWVKLYKKQPSARDQSIIWEHLDGSLVISFEMPEIIRRALEALSIPYIDFTIHPVRFLDDLAFGLRSNASGLGAVLAPHVLYDEEIQVAAGLARATLAKIGRLQACATGIDLALFAGQTTDDKVLIHDGRFLAAEDFMDKFAEISASHSKVLVKPHPYAAQNPIVLALTRLFRNVSIVDANFYHLLSHESISHVYSLTSSTSIEAAYFGKNGVHLAPYPYYFSDQSAISGQFLSIHPDIYLPQFWQAVLTLLSIESRAVKPIRVSHLRSRMRHTLRSYWGAKILEEAA